jgi:hypothetical protein
MDMALYLAFISCKLSGPFHYTWFPASTCCESIHVTQRVHVHYTWQLGRMREVRGSPTTYAVNRRSITTFQRRDHRHAWDATCFLAATKIRTWCLVTNIATFSDKLTSMVFCWKYWWMIIAYQNSIHTYLWRQCTKPVVSHTPIRGTR